MGCKQPLSRLLPSLFVRCRCHFHGLHFHIALASYMFSDGHAAVRPPATSGHAAVRPPATYTAQQGCSHFQWVGISLAC